MTSKGKSEMAIRPIKAIPTAKVVRKATAKVASVGDNLHPETRQILETAKTMKAGQVFEIRFSDANKAKRRRDAVMRYLKAHGASIKRIVQQGKMLYVEVGRK